MSIPVPDCPRCKIPMIRGEFEVGQTGLGFLAAGMALPHLFFLDTGGNRKTAFDWTNNAQSGYFCETCSACLILPA